jgi:hypothetical protein
MKLAKDVLLLQNGSHINKFVDILPVCLKKQKERYTMKPSGKRLKLDVAVDDEDLQSAISAIVALEHSEAVSTVTTEVQESDD